MSAVFNMLDRLPYGQVVQLRDPHGEILWEGAPVDGEIRAIIARTGIISTLNLPDGQPIIGYDNPRRTGSGTRLWPGLILYTSDSWGGLQAVHEGDTWTWHPGATLSPRMLNICAAILSVVCVIWAKVTLG